jgi:magnesium chelatase family protein
MSQTLIQMATAIRSAALIGIDAHPLTVEADLSSGLPSFTIVGLPDAAVKESRERVRSAIKNSGFTFPAGRLTVNLAPADSHKEGAGYDLPIAVAVLAACGYILKFPYEALFIGELSLDGSVRTVPGVLAIAQLAASSKAPAFFVPTENAAEAALVPGLTIIPVTSLTALLMHLDGTRPIEPLPHTVPELTDSPWDTDLAAIRGQQTAKRCLTIAAAGGHNVLLSGPPGSGKTLLAHALPGIMPPLSFDEALEVTRIYSAAGAMPAHAALIHARPFRHPHHSASAVAMVGGGAAARPGEISLAHRGVLFMDEFPEFPRNVLEHLRQPLEDGLVTVSRAAGTHIYPAKFLLVAARNPCPCGYAGDQQIGCSCSPARLGLYQKKLSGPLLDRIDLSVDVPRQSFAALVEKKDDESSATVRARVVAARAIQSARYAATKILTNSELRPRGMATHCVLTPHAHALVGAAVDRMHLSARAYHRILKVARTIADLAKNETIEESHVAEALQYRPRLD